MDDDASHLGAELFDKIKAGFASFCGLLLDYFPRLKIAVLINPVFKASPSKDGFKFLLRKGCKIERICGKRLRLAFDDTPHRLFGLRKNQMCAILIYEGATDSVLFRG